MPAPALVGTGRAGEPPAHALADKAMLARLAVGRIAKFRFADVPRSLPELRVSSIDGTARRLDDWRGRMMLLNVWASWCAPCREEMPALQGLQEALAADGLVVVTLSFDKTPADAARFLADLGLASLPLLVDPGREALEALSVEGAPTSILVDPSGRELGRIAGAVDWASPEAMLLVKAMIVKSATSVGPAD
ncbi:MAG: TlpA disulfide reductase family protein [Pseudomonadota bacterium]